MKKLLIVFIVLSFILSSCNFNESPKTELEKFEWLIGSWKNINEERELHETWIKVNDTLMSGKSYMLLLKDTVFSETILIQSIGNDIYYVPTVIDQNHGKAIPFKLISVSNGEFIFENEKHDFPQRISYSNPKQDSLHAYVEGEENGQFQRSDFFLKKYREN